MQTVAAVSVTLPELESLVRRLLGAGEGFPPCDVMWTSDGRLRISLAVAGFCVDDLTVAVMGDQLVVRGRRQPDQEPRQFLHRGIAMRRFQRAFSLGPGLRVRAARLENGLLDIELERIEASPAHKVPIAGPAPRD